MAKKLKLKLDAALPPDPRKAQKVVREDGTEVKPGDKIKSFRGTSCVFVGIARAADLHPRTGEQVGPSGGKLYVKERRGGETHESVYYPSVFDLEIVLR